ncbi:molybdopterin binding domain-containing protein [Ceratocystis lukuohia]|uniref:Molybdopterin binding domain-containing protein n=1 Tax=Ceratocystis lukuohia TaxID=2019550 RepID=A0ABR4MQ14_9PEZI
MASADERNNRPIRTAACLIIGDEVLGGKELKRIEVIGDDEEEIAEAVSRMSSKYDFVVTSTSSLANIVSVLSGGIGPTHDDITYQAIGKAFSLPLTMHQPTYDRMKRLMKPHPSQPNFDWNVESPDRTARERMVILPLDLSRDLSKQIIYTWDDLWVPVTVVNGNVHILPGIPQLFERLIDGLKPSISPRLEGQGTHRVLISTPMSESAVALYLTKLAAVVEPKGIKVGSYPRFEKSRNTVTLVGQDQEYLESLVPEVIENVKGRRVTVEGEDDEPEAT